MERLVERMGGETGGETGEPITTSVNEQQIRQDIIANITQGLARLAAGEAGVDSDTHAQLLEVISAEGKPEEVTTGATAGTTPSGDYLAPWIETEECTACDECTRINSKIFAYNDNKKAIIKDARGGPYRDLVRAAEKCSARIIHPGLPADRTEKDIEKWIKRGEKYN